MVVIVSLVVSGVIAGLDASDLLNLEDKIREETLPVAASRLTSSAYPLLAVERGSMEINFTAPYTINDSSGRLEIEYGKSTVPVSDYTGKIKLVEAAESRTWCFSKTEDRVLLKPGDCG